MAVAVTVVGHTAVISVRVSTVRREAAWPSCPRELDPTRPGPGPGHVLCAPGWRWRALDPRKKSGAKQKMARKNLAGFVNKKFLRPILNIDIQSPPPLGQGTLGWEDGGEVAEIHVRREVRGKASASQKNPQKCFFGHFWHIALGVISSPLLREGSAKIFS